jgi:tetratricopeptide (TPR) repeat protein
MVESRLEILKSLVAQNPSDSFARYALAMACANAGDYTSAAEQHRKLIEINPRYVAAYFHGGQALEKLGKVDEARELYRRGIEACTQAGDLHTRSELEAALELLG